MASEVAGGGADDAEHRVLRGRVRHLPGMRGIGVDGRHRDDRAAVIPHGGRRVLQGRGHAANVDRHHAIPLVEVKRGGRPPGRHDAGVGDDDVEPAEALLDGADRACQGRLVRHVAGQRRESVERGGGLERLRLIEHEAGGAFQREQRGDRPAEPARAARHERDPALQQACHRRA